MAITIIQEPNTFFNCTDRAIIEFTTDSNLGSTDNYLADVLIKSSYSNKTAVIRNVPYNTYTKIFWVDISDFIKTLQLYDFNFNFNGTKNLSVEKFEISIKVKDGSIIDDTTYSFDDYFFDNVVFTDGISVIDSSNIIKYSILGERLMFDNNNNKLFSNSLTFLAPENIEYCNGFDNYISVFNNEMNNQSLIVNSVLSPINYTKGVSTALLPNGINNVTEIECTNQTLNTKLFAIPYNFINCDKIVQFRFYNNKGGFSYFYSDIDSHIENRSKVTFVKTIDKDVQYRSEYKSELKFKGSKNIKLKELFSMLLRSPKVEINLKQINGNDFFIECDIQGSMTDTYLTYEYNLTAKIENTGNFNL